MPEGDTIAWTAHRLRPVLLGQVPVEIRAPRTPQWSSRLGGRAVRTIDTHGKHLFIHFDGDLVVHSHLGMVGSWTVLRHDPRGSARSPSGLAKTGPAPRRPAGRRAWLALRVGDCWVVQFDGPTLELLTSGRVRFDQRLAALGPDVLAPEFDRERFLALLRSDDPTRPIGDALLDQRTVAGIGNIWKAEGCWEASIDPWRVVASVSDREALAIIDAVRPRMQRSAVFGPREIRARVYRMTGRPCPRCGTAVRAQGQGDANRTTYWCPGCQS